MLGPVFWDRTDMKDLDGTPRSSSLCARGPVGLGIFLPRAASLHPLPARNPLPYPPKAAGMNWGVQKIKPNLPPSLGAGPGSQGLD